MTYPPWLAPPLSELSLSAASTGKDQHTVLYCSTLDKQQTTESAVRHTPCSTVKSQAIKPRLSVDNLGAMWRCRLAAWPLGAGHSPS